MERKYQKELCADQANLCNIYRRSTKIKNLHFKKRYFQIGSSMIEVLVSLFVLAVGLFGLLSLQTNSLTVSQSALFVSESHLLAVQMADHILSYGASGKGAADGNFVTDTIINNYETVQCALSCNETQQIKHIQASWEQALQARLPGGAGTVTWDSMHLIYTITVMWRYKGHSFVNINCGDFTAADLVCFVMQVKL